MEDGPCPAAVAAQQALHVFDYLLPLGGASTGPRTHRLL